MQCTVYFVPVQYYSTTVLPVQHYSVSYVVCPSRQYMKLQGMNQLFSCPSLLCPGTVETIPNMSRIHKPRIWRYDRR